MTTPADLALTPLQAIGPDIMRSYHGRLFRKAGGTAEIRFRDITHAAAWAGATGMVERSLIKTPNDDMSLDTTVVLILDISDWHAGRCALCHEDLYRDSHRTLRTEDHSGVCKHTTLPHRLQP